MASDVHLVERARAGDLDAFNALVDLYQRQVYSLCLRMLGTREAAEDATQEVFLSAYRRLGDFRGGQFRSWLLRIATNVSIDELRRRKRYAVVPLEREAGGEAVTVEAPDPKAGPEELALGTELRASLERALATLPPEQRAAVVLADVQGLSYEEVAGVLGCSLGTVKSRIFRARERLRAFLQALPEPPAPAVRPTGERSNVTRGEGL
jgi:RNA polymerase sigma-70 factor (ECF subfamily)